MESAGFRLMQELHDRSLPSVELLQTSFPNGDALMVRISTLLDPRYVFLVLVPLVFALNPRVGHRLAAALTLAEWSNQLLKWLLAGERPYWYVHERALELAGSGPGAPLNGSTLAAAAGLTRLRQFPVTCELGAGSPSGHAMVAATVWFVIIDALLRHELWPGAAQRPTSGAAAKLGELKKPLPAPAAAAAAAALWAAYAAMLLAVSLSRVYLACHFPHQCLAGAGLGALTGYLVSGPLEPRGWRRRHYLLAAGAMFASAMATYWGLRWLGADPLWSVHKGTRWCVKPEYIHLDTTPFFSMTRYLGFGLGAGLAQAGASWAPASPPGGVWRWAATGAASVAFGQLLLALPVPRANLQLYYVISFALYALFSFAVAATIPRLLLGGPKVAAWPHVNKPRQE